MIEFAPRHTRALTWDDAWLYCVTLEHNGYSDWRMPTAKESGGLGWYDTDIDLVYQHPTLSYPVSPVRDINA